MKHIRSRMTGFFLLALVVVGAVMATAPPVTAQGEQQTDLSASEGTGVTGSEARRRVLVLEIEGVIDPIVARYVQRSTQGATRAETEMIVVRLDTPGGLDSATRQIVQAILNCGTPVGVFVGPAGARAASAGVFITLAAHVSGMAPGTNIGAAHPVDLGQGELPETLEDKVTNDAVAYIQAIAHERGRDAAWAEQAVRQSASLTAQEALDKGIVDVLATDVASFLDKLDGRRVALLGGDEVLLNLDGAPVVYAPLTWLEVIAHGLIDPNIAYLLLSLGTLALLAEIYNPGAILPGVTGIIALLLAFVALGNLPVNWGGIALIVLAFVFFIADIKVQGIALSIAGAISFVLGSLLLFSPFTPIAPTMPQFSVSPWLLVVMTALVIGFFAIVVVAGVRAQRQTARMGAHVLVGKTGAALTELNPYGTVQVHSEVWSALAKPDPIAAGETVEVTGVEGLRLQVRRPG